jgi:hypothetical protein
MRRSIIVAAALLSAAPATAATIYLGPSASFGAAVPAGSGSGNQRADTTTSLTYIFTTGSYTAASAIQVQPASFYLANQDAGSITPFIAEFLGGTVNSGLRYKVLAKGDAVSVAAGNAQGVLRTGNFTVGGNPVTLALTTGQTIVAGLYQTTRNVVFAGGSNVGTLIYTGNVIPAVGSAFPANPNFYFTTQNYRFDLALTTVTRAPQPASAALIGVGLAALASGTRLRRRG